MTTIWVMAFVLLVIVMKVAFKVVRVLLGAEGVAFDVRQLPDFVSSDVLLDLGGLLILSLPTFIEPTGTGLPGQFAALLAALQALFWAVALAIAGKHIAKIRDYYPDIKNDDGAQDVLDDDDPDGFETDEDGPLSDSAPNPNETPF